MNLALKARLKCGGYFPGAPNRKIATLNSFAPSALGSVMLRFLGLRFRPKPARSAALGNGQFFSGEAARYDSLGLSERPALVGSVQKVQQKKGSW